MIVTFHQAPSPPPIPNYLDWYWQILTQSNHLYEGQNLNPKNYTIKINCYDALQILMPSFEVFFFVLVSSLEPMYPC